VVAGVLGWIGVLLGFQRDAWAAVGLAVGGVGLMLACGFTEAAERRKAEGEGRVALESED